MPGAEASGSCTADKARDSAPSAPDGYAARPAQRAGYVSWDDQPKVLLSFYWGHGPARRSRTASERRVTRSLYGPRWPDLVPGATAAVRGNRGAPRAWRGAHPPRPRADAAAD